MKELEKESIKTNCDRSIRDLILSKIALEVQNLEKNYGGLQAVRGISFKVLEGQIFGLIGPNGAGKTTTFNMIAGSEIPTKGKIFLYSKDITGVPTHKLYDLGLLRTFQLSQEYKKMTVLENLMVAGSNQVGENIFNSWFSSKKVNLREKKILEKAFDSLEFLGLSNLKSELAGNLSGGQKKLLEIGRTMMTDAKLVLLDEPGAGVNPTLMLKIIDMIRRLNVERGYTFCIIEHDMDLIADLCQKVVVLSEGQVLTEGAMSNVKNDERVIQAYFGGGADI